MPKKEARPAKRADPAKRASPTRRATLRRVPMQDRGKARVEAILDAAELAFAEAGYDGATTEDIAARAGASIGSLYQFFPNKRALFDALSARYLERSKALFDQAVTSIPPDARWEDVLDGTIDAFWAITSGQPAFAAVWLHGRITKELIDAGLAMNRAFAERAEEVMERFAPDHPRATRAVVATVVVEAVSSMLLAAARAPSATSRRLIDETKRMLRAYLREVLAQAGS